MGADAGIVAYDGASYAYTIGSGTNAIVSAANDRVQPNAADADIAVRVINSSVPTSGDAFISMNQFSNTNDRTANPAVRFANDATVKFYMMYMNRLSGEADIYRVDDATHFVLLDNPSRAIGAGHAVTLKAVTNGAQVDITGTISGLADVTFSDTSASRLLAGVPGFHMFNTGVTMSSWLDNLSVDDGGAATTPITVNNLPTDSLAGGEIV